MEGDLNGDGKISIGDLAIMAKYYGKTSADPNWNTYQIADLNHDGIIDINDLAKLASMIQ
nr:dockerin type I domain-containing protein [Paenibacillus sp. 1_12]